MRVVCDQCSSTYKVPNEKLTKPINKATCRNCGARLLIPKPQPGADPDERVVVPAVPATTGVGDRGLVAPAESDDDDKTMPVVRKSAPASGPAPAEQDDIAIDDGEATTVQRRPVPLTVERPSPASAAPQPARSAPSAPAPRPSSASTAREAPGGMGVAFAGALIALLGLLLLSLPAGAAPAEALLVGRFLGFAGATTAMLVLGMSNFGRQDGQGAVALGGGLVFGGLVTFALTAIPTADPSAPATVRAAPASTPEAPAEVASEDEPAETVAAKTEAPASEAKAAASRPSSRSASGSAEAEPAPRTTTRSEPASRTPSSEPAPRSEPSRTTTAPSPAPSGSASEPSPAPSRSPSSTATRTAPATERDVLEPEPDPEPEPLPPRRTTSAPKPSGTASPEPDKSDGLMATVPPSVISTIVTTNVGVKRCFYESLKSREITKPITISTTFNLSASGSASNLRVNNEGLGGSSLERCLDGAFRKMTFPKAAKGGPVNFPFKL